MGVHMLEALHALWQGVRAGNKHAMTYWPLVHYMRASSNPYKHKLMRWWCCLGASQEILQ